MPGPPVTLGCSVVATPGLAGAPDTGVIAFIPPPFVLVGGMPAATAGSICQMVNSVTSAPYPLVIGPLGSGGVRIAGRALVRLGDRIPSPPGVLLIVGPPAAPFVNDQWAP
jgi:uncharacterized Zn-binding protein involved in type VI secretion